MASRIVVVDRDSSSDDDEGGGIACAKSMFKEFDRALRVSPVVDIGQRDYTLLQYADINVKQDGSGTPSTDTDDDMQIRRSLGIGDSIRETIDWPNIYVQYDNIRRRLVHNRPRKPLGWPLKIPMTEENIYLLDEGEYERSLMWSQCSKEEYSKHILWEAEKDVSSIKHERVSHLFRMGKKPFVALEPRPLRKSCLVLMFQTELNGANVTNFNLYDESTYLQKSLILLGLRDMFANSDVVNKEVNFFVKSELSIYTMQLYLRVWNQTEGYRKQTQTTLIFPSVLVPPKKCSIADVFKPALTLTYPQHMHITGIQELRIVIECHGTRGQSYGPGRNIPLPKRLNIVCDCGRNNPDCFCYKSFLRTINAWCVGKLHLLGKTINAVALRYLEQYDISFSAMSVCILKIMDEVLWEKFRTTNTSDVRLFSNDVQIEVGNYSTRSAFLVQKFVTSDIIQRPNMKFIIYLSKIILEPNYLVASLAHLCVLAWFYTLYGNVLRCEDMDAKYNDLAHFLMAKLPMVNTITVDSAIRKGSRKRLLTGHLLKTPFTCVRCSGEKVKVKRGTTTLLVCKQCDGQIKVEPDW